jgi:hypothetical protein
MLYDKDLLQNRPQEHEGPTFVHHNSNILLRRVLTTLQYRTDNRD